MTGEATLSNEKNYTVFCFGNHVIRFAAPYSLEHYYHRAVRGRTESW